MVMHPTVFVRPLDITVTPATTQDVVRLVTERRSEHRLLLNHNLHSAYLFQTDSRFRDLYDRATAVLIDGAPILWLARRAHGRPGIRAAHRLGSTDWISSLPPSARLKLFVYGARRESNAAAIAALKDRLHGWKVDGINGYAPEDQVVARISSFQPDLVVVGLGMPRQEDFLSRRLQDLPPAMYATVGGAIDYIAGQNRLSPRWVGRYGAEWLWRLAHEPRRLGHRYVIEPFKLVPHVVKNLRRQEETT